MEAIYEQKRGCGYRKPSTDGVGIYLMGPVFSEVCERLPFPLSICPVCGNGIKFSRGFTWIEPERLFAKELEPKCIFPMNLKPDQPVPPYTHAHHLCPMCSPHLIGGEKAGMLWVGVKYYTPESFMNEADEMGISKKIRSIPRGFEIGKHWIYLAHKHAIPQEAHQDSPTFPGVFTVFKPTHVDLVIEDENSIPEKAVRLAEKLGDKAKIVKVISKMLGEEVDSIATRE